MDKRARTDHLALARVVIEDQPINIPDLRQESNRGKRIVSQNTFINEV